MNIELKIGKLWIQDHRTNKYIGTTRTTGSSYLRVFWDLKFAFDIPMPRIDNSPINRDSSWN